MVDMFFINSHAELAEMMQAYSPKATKRRQGRHLYSMPFIQVSGKVFLQVDQLEQVPESVDRAPCLELCTRGRALFVLCQGLEAAACQVGALLSHGAALVSFFMST